MKKYILAFTGASGQVLGLRLLSELVKTAHIYVVASSGALSILKDESGFDLSCNDPSALLRAHLKSPNIDFFFDSNLHAPISSGSFPVNGMFIVPCSMKTLASVANGLAKSLIERSADVTIKEGRKLILSPREMPFSAIHLENMLKLSRLGVKIAPPVPAFYHKPESIEEMLDFLTGKILDCMGIENNLYKRWEGK